MQEYISSKLPKTNAEYDRLEKVVVELLQKIPEMWDDCDEDSLTDTQEKARLFLVAAGMVERRGSFRLRMLNHPLTIDATWSATGESGFSEAVSAVADAMWNEWSGPWQTWQDSHPGNGQPFQVETLVSDEWRLTDQGVIARSDIEQGDPGRVFQFVFNRRKSVQGSGSLIRLDKKTETPRQPTLGTGQRAETHSRNRSVHCLKKHSRR